MPSKFDINPDTGMEYGVNPATGVQDDNYWANIVEPQFKSLSGASGGSNPADELIKSITDQYEKTAKEYESRLSEFEKRSPFSFDKVLEEESKKAGQRLDPYYQQTLNDFLTGVNTRRTRSIADQKSLLSDLGADVESYTGESRVKLDQALQRTREGYADQGLYFSGARGRAEGQIENQSQTDMANYLRGTQRQERTANLLGSRQREDLNLEQQLTQRDIGQYDPNTGQFNRGARSEAQVRSEGLNETLRRQNLRDFEKQQVLGTPPGVNPFQYQYQSFSKLG